MSFHNVTDLLWERAALHPDRTAIVEYRRGRPSRTTFGELAAEVAAYARRLRDRGIGPGDRVLLFVPMSRALYASVLACMHLRAPAVFIDAWADRERLERAVAAARPRAFIGSRKAHLLRLTSRAIRELPLHLLPPAPAHAPAPAHTPEAGPPGLASPSKQHDYRANSALNTQHLTPNTPSSDPEHRNTRIPEYPGLSAQAALVTLTTGSTGLPKAASRSHAFLLAQHRALAAYMQPRETDIDMPGLPVFVLHNLALGIPSVLPDFDPRRPAELDPARIFRQIEAEGVTTSSGSPAFYERLAGWCRQKGRKLPLRAVFTGGAPVLPRLARLLLETVEGEAHAVYGSTEAEPIAGVELGAMLSAQEEAAGDPLAGLCAGLPVPGLSLRVLRPHNGPITLDEGWDAWQVPPGEAGEIVVAGAHVLTGYDDDPEAERETKIRDGAITWHRTGDGGRLDTQGRLWLLGRVRERVTRQDCVWWPLPAELRALDCPGVTHAAYLRVPDGKLGQRAVLCVESTRPPSGEALVAALAPIPVDEVRCLRRIPRDPRHASKTDTAALRRLHQGLGCRV